MVNINGRLVTPFESLSRSIADTLQASQEDHDLARELFDKLPQWLEQGTIKPNNTKVLIGLDSVPQGFQEYRDQVISAYKIVYEL